MLTADLLSADILKVSMSERLFSVEGHSEILQAELKTCVLRLFLCVCAVFTQGEKGTLVAGIFTAFSVVLHLAEAARASAASKGFKKGSLA